MPEPFDTIDLHLEVTIPDLIDQAVDDDCELARISSRLGTMSAHVDQLLAIATFNRTHLARQAG